MTAYVLTLDPGLEQTGGALWRAPATTAYVGDLRELLVGTFTLRAPATLTLGGQQYARSDEVRHRLLCEQLDTQLGARSPCDLEAVFIEQPAIARGYRARGSDVKNAADVQRNVRVGGVLAGYLMTRTMWLQFVPADSKRKKDRHARLELLGLTAPNEHERDAVALGARVLTDSRRSWQERRSA